MSQEENKMPVSEIALHLITSIRTLDGRLDELFLIVKNEKFDKECRKQLKARIESLIETRMSLVYSFMDIRPFLINALDKEHAIKNLTIVKLYEDLKRKW